MLAGYAVDLVVGDPQRRHPVAGFGQWACRVERRLYRDSRAAGVGYAAATAGAAVLAGAAARRVARDPVSRALLVAAATWTVLGGTSLLRVAGELGDRVAAGDLDGGRDLLPSLCGRDPRGLDAAELSRAAVESVAENTSDAVIAPLFWGAVAGLPGLLGYRAVNTLDAMVGHRSPRYARFGWAAARTDDLANLVPARLTGMLGALAAPLVGGRPTAALQVMRTDGGNHPSPNAGRCEAAFAGALGVQLGGTNVYGGRVERRGSLGDGRRPEPGDVARAARLSRAVSAAAVLLAVAARSALGEAP
jgi:adenosylcobinamide-phosphate synthase